MVAPAGLELLFPGPVIAWLIRLATELLGGLSLKLTGSLMLAVRLPAVLLGGLTAWGIFRLASMTTGGQRAGMIAVLLLPAIPILAIGGVVITSDTPLVCCWAWAAVWTYRGVLRDDTRAWVVGRLDRGPRRPGEVLVSGVPRLGRSVPAAQPGASPPVGAARVLGDVADLRRSRARPDPDLECSARLGGSRPVGRSSGAVESRDLGQHLARAQFSWRRDGRARRDLVGGGAGGHRRCACPGRAGQPRSEPSRRPCGSTRLPRKTAPGFSIFFACGE